MFPSVHALSRQRVFAVQHALKILHTVKSVLFAGTGSNLTALVSIRIPDLDQSCWDNADPDPDPDLDPDRRI